MGNRTPVHCRRKPAKMTAIDPDDREDLQDWQQFKAAVKSGAFIDYDGFGRFATADRVSDVVVVPSSLSKPGFRRPTWATHVLWYNR